MKALMLALLLPFLMILSSCACKPTIEYVDRVEFINPQLPDLLPTEYPSVRLQVWGDYAIYKQQCEAQIDRCNTDKRSIPDSLQLDRP
jgi:hypothetical protein